MRRDHEAKQELNIRTDDDRQPASEERPLDEQRAPAPPLAPKPSLVTRIWRAITQ
jgi:hypothetical protein